MSAGTVDFTCFSERKPLGRQIRTGFPEDSGIKTSGLESMAEPRLEDDAETSKSTVHELAAWSA